MLRIRTGARHGLRWGMFGFVAAALFTISSDPSHAAPYADIVVDANSGTVLHSTNPDAQRHPASLTKIMTLYLLFEQLEAGKLKLDSQLQVSEGRRRADADQARPQARQHARGRRRDQGHGHAFGQRRRRGGGGSDRRRRGRVRQADDAQGAGARHEPHRLQERVRPARFEIRSPRRAIKSTLGRAIQERFPRYYKYFSIRSFTFRGQSIGNHNHLLGRVEGVDGIKTGYVNASGFNLVTSVHRGNRYLVAVVMGGSSAGSRDAKMRDLINDKIAQASVKRTAPMVAEGFVPPEAKPEPKAVAKVESETEPKVAAKVEAKPEPKAEAKTERARIQERGAVRRRQRRQPARALQFRAARRPTGHDQIGVAGGGRATAHRRRLDRSDPAGAGEDAVGQGGNADRVARADAVSRSPPAAEPAPVLARPRRWRRPRRRPRSSRSSRSRRHRNRRPSVVAAKPEPARTVPLRRSRRRSRPPLPGAGARRASRTCRP